MNYYGIFTVPRYRLYLILFIILSILFSFTDGLIYKWDGKILYASDMEPRFGDDNLCIEIGALLFLFPLAVSLYRKNESIDSDDRTVFFSVWAVQLLYLGAIYRGSVFLTVFLKFNVVLLFWMTLFLLPLWYAASYWLTPKTISGIFSKKNVEPLIKIPAVFLFSYYLIYIFYEKDFLNQLFFGNEYYILANSPVKDFLLYTSGHFLFNGLFWLPLLVFAVYFRKFKNGLLLTTPILMVIFLLSHMLTKYFWEFQDNSYISWLYFKHTYLAVLLFPILWYVKTKLKSIAIQRTISIILIFVLFTTSLWIYQFITSDYIMHWQNNPQPIEIFAFTAIAIPEALLFSGNRGELLDESVQMNSAFMVEFLLRFDIDRDFIFKALHDAEFGYASESIEYKLDRAYRAKLKSQ